MGTNYIAPTWRMPRNANKDKLSNYSIEFVSGTSDEINCGQVTQLQNASVVSWNFWVNFSTENFNVVWSKGVVGTSDIIQFYTWAGAIATGYLWIKVGGVTFDSLINNFLGSGGLININEWNMFTVVFDGSEIGNDRLKIYLNGGNTNIITSYSGSSPANLPNTTQEFYIGRGASNDFKGKISQFTIFDYALSENQRTYLNALNNPMAITGAEPIAYWPLGDNANPIATAGYPNISVGADSVFDFDSDVIEVSNSSALRITGNMTLSAWIKSDNISSNQTLISKNGAGGRNYVLWLLGSKLRLNTATEGAYANSTLQSNTWYHVAVSVISGTGYFYVNGEPDGSSTFTVTPPATDQPFYIGRGYSPAAYDYFEGEMSNVQVWDAGLSPENITTLYNNGQPLMTGTQPEEANLKAWYKLNQSANWEADSAGNWQIPDAVSAYPQSFEFDGVSNEMTLPKGSITDTGAKSVSVWVKNEITSGTDYIFNSRNGGYLANGITLIQRHSDSTGYITSNSYSPFQSSKIFTGYQTALHIPNDGQWHHMAWTAFPQAQRLKVYIDGVFVYEFIGATTVDTTPSTNINVGQSGSPWTGKLSNFQVWDDVILSDGGVALNDPATGQIAELYNNGSPLTTAIESSNLKAWYKLDDNEQFDGTNWSLENQKYPANYETALNFTGSIGNEHLETASSADLIMQGSHSFSLWLKTGTTSDTVNYIFDKGTLDYSLSLNSNSLVLIYYNYQGGGGSNTILTLDSDWLTDYALSWHHVIVTVDQPNLLVKLYVDGDLIGTPIALPADYLAPDNSTGNLNIMSYNGSTLSLSGQLSNLAFFNGTVLQQSDIDTIYNNGTPELALSASPTSWWKINNTGTGLVDNAGSDNLTNTGATEVNTFVSTEAGTSSAMTEQNLVNNNVSTLNGESSGMNTTNLVQSNISKQIPFSSYSVLFNGVDDIFDCGNPSNLQISTDISISCWFKCTDQGIIISKGQYAGEIAGNGFNWSLSVRSPGYGLAWQWYTTSSDGSASGDRIYYLATTGDALTVIDGEWHNLVVTRSSTDSNLWLDGVYFASTGNTASNLDYMVNSSQNVIIGDASNSVDPFPGNLSNIAIWNQLLTADDALNIYNNGISQDLNSFRLTPISWWALDQSYTYFNGSVLVARDVISGNDGTGANVIQENIVGNAPGSEANGTGTNLDLSDLIGDMKDSKINSYSINMADYADGVTNPANSGRSTLVP